MENKTHLIGAGVSLFIGISILACGGGLGGGLGGEPCTFDADCSTAGQVCGPDSECIDTCTVDEDCFLGESCLPRPGNNSGFTCQVDDNTGGTDMGGGGNAECVENEDCPLFEGTEGVCLDGVCDYPMPETTYRWIMVQDTSSGDDACGNTDPGSDLMGVRLLDAGGQIVGWGSAGNESFGDAPEGNNYENTSRLDGTAQGLETQSCPEAGTRFVDLQPSVLGCGGWVLVEFVDGGSPQNISEGMQIEVLEYGSTCGGSSDDSYEVYLCTDSADAQGGSNSSCTEALGGRQEGIGTVTVSF